MSIIFPSFKKYPELVYDFSERQHGSMRWISDEKIYVSNLENRKRFFAQKNISIDDIVTTELVHGSNVVEVFLSDMGVVVNKTDALVTSDKDTFLTVTGADCFSVYFYEPQSKIIGLAHVGWKGLVGGIVPNTIEKIVKLKYPETLQGETLQGETLYRDSILVSIGPGIRQCHFSVSLDNLYHYDQYPKAIYRNENSAFIDIPAIIKEQCIVAGVKIENIDDINLCTYCSKDKYFSHRRDQSEPLEVMVAYLGMA